MSAKVSCPVLRGGERGDSQTSPDIIPKSKGEKDEYKNLQLLHRHCHDIKTANDGSYGSKSDCNSVEPKPTKRLERVEDKWVMRYA